ncbi:unnamed protein product [Amoebophrya sp. A120]|nr:unnamed protein product [Amoebophrya sp. A120]|eukprot:GSA120T00020822001.1
MVEEGPSVPASSSTVGGNARFSPYRKQLRDFLEQTHVRQLSQERSTVAVIDEHVPFHTMLNAVLEFDHHHNSAWTPPDSGMSRGADQQAERVAAYHQQYGLGTPNLYLPSDVLSEVAYISNQDILTSGAGLYPGKDGLQRTELDGPNGTSLTVVEDASEVKAQHPLTFGELAYYMREFDERPYLTTTHLHALRNSRAANRKARKQSSTSSPSGPMRSGAANNKNGSTASSSIRGHSKSGTPASLSKQNSKDSAGGGTSGLLLPSYVLAEPDRDPLKVIDEDEYLWSGNNSCTTSGTSSFPQQLNGSTSAASSKIGADHGNKTTLGGHAKMMKSSVSSASLSSQSRKNLLVYKARGTMRPMLDVDDREATVLRAVELLLKYPRLNALPVVNAATAAVQFYVTLRQILAFIVIHVRDASLEPLCEIAVKARFCKTLHYRYVGEESGGDQAGNLNRGDHAQLASTSTATSTPAAKVVPDPSLDGISRNTSASLYGEAATSSKTAPAPGFVDNNAKNVPENAKILYDTTAPKTSVVPGCHWRTQVVKDSEGGSGTAKHTAAPRASSSTLAGQQQQQAGGATSSSGPAAHQHVVQKEAGAASAELGIGSSGVVELGNNQDKIEKDSETTSPTATEETAETTTTAASTSKEELMPGGGSGSAATNPGNKSSSTSSPMKQAAPLPNSGSSPSSGNTLHLEDKSLQSSATYTVIRDSTPFRHLMTFFYEEHYSSIPIIDRQTEVMLGSISRRQVLQYFDVCFQMALDGLLLPEHRLRIDMEQSVGEVFRQIELLSWSMVQYKSAECRIPVPPVVNPPGGRPPLTLGYFPQGGGGTIPERNSNYNAGGAGTTLSTPGAGASSSSSQDPSFGNKSEQHQPGQLNGSAAAVVAAVQQNRNTMPNNINQPPHQLTPLEQQAVLLGGDPSTLGAAAGGTSNFEQNNPPVAMPAGVLVAARGPSTTGDLLTSRMPGTSWSYRPVTSLKDALQLVAFDTGGTCHFLDREGVLTRIFTAGDALQMLLYDEEEVLPVGGMGQL